MTMLRTGTRPGSPDRVNEDFIGVTGGGESTCLVLLDGAGGPAELPNGCQHGTGWFVTQLGSALLADMARPVPLDHALAASIRAVSRMHDSTCDLEAPGTPSSTAVMVRVHGDLLEYLVLGDSTLVIDVGEAISAISDKRIDTVASEYFARMSALPVGTPEHQQARIRYVANQRSYRNRAGGYWAVSTDPHAATQARTGVLRRADVRQVALLSDGATRYVEFGLGGWHDLLNVLADHGPDALFDLVRAAEESDPDGARWPRAKRHDDIAAIWLS